MRFANVLAILLVSIIMWSCNKEIISPVPVINFVKQSTTMVADSGIGENPVLFEFGFKDGDGDLGPVEGQIPANPIQNVIFIGERTDTTARYAFDFPPIPGAAVQRDGIEGSFEIFVPANIFIARDDPEHEFFDTVTFKVFVFDAQGNISDTVSTRPIVIEK